MQVDCDKIKLTSFLAEKDARDGPPNRGRDELDKVPPDLRRYVLWLEELLQDKTIQTVKSNQFRSHINITCSTSGRKLGGGSNC